MRRPFSPEAFPVFSRDGRQGKARIPKSKRIFSVIGRRPERFFDMEPTQPIQETVSVSQFGAAGGGIADDAPAVQAALFSGARRVVIPAGTYRLGAPLRVPSHIRIEAAPDAVLILADGVCHTRDDALLTNADLQNGNEDISVRGGIWDGNNPGNPRPQGLYGEGYTGACFRFLNVSGLSLAALTLRDPEGYYICLGGVRDFQIRDIRLLAEHLRPNQDGIHLGGFCENGEIFGVSGEGSAPNDDLLALNADDCVDRVTNLGLRRGPIRSIRAGGLRAESCHAFLRILSVDSLVENVCVDGVRGGFRSNAVNLDAARYCRTPLFEDAPGVHVGKLRGVGLSDFHVYKTLCGDGPYLQLETDAQRFTIAGFIRDSQRDAAPGAPTLLLRKTGAAAPSLTGADETALTSAGGARLVSAGGRIEAKVPAGGSLCLGAGGFDLFSIL